MDGYTLAELREKLQAVRGETRVKAAEEPIRNTFLSEAVKEIFTEHNWLFNKRVAEIETDEEGAVDLPADFSLMNDYWLIVNGMTYNKDDLTVLVDRGRLTMTGPISSTGILHYYLKAPNIIVKDTEKVYFPEPLLIAERAYVRLKTAYFPDESSEKELQQSKVALRQLYAATKPKTKFTHKAL